MDSLKDLFNFDQREKIALIILGVLIIVVFLGNLSISFLHRKITYNQVLTDSISLRLLTETNAQKQGFKPADSIQSFHMAEADKHEANIRLTPFPFNPNTLTEDEWKKIGLSERQIRTIRNYLSKGGEFYKKEDLAKIYTISKEEFSILEPFIDIPSVDSTKVDLQSTKQRLKDPTSNAGNVLTAQKITLNEADSLTLLTISELTPWLVHRILRYRQELGGFAKIEQLTEIKGFEKSLLETIIPRLTMDTLNIDPLPINRLSFKELLKHPYFEFEHTKAVINYREKRGFIKDVEKLMIVSGLDQSTINKLKPYIRFD